MNEVGYGKPPTLTQFKPGESGNPDGRPKGSKNLATIIRELEAEDFDWSLIPRHGENLKKRFGHLGSPLRVVVYLALLQTLTGDKEARQWLKDAGYGNKIDITSNGKTIQAPLIMAPIQARNAPAETETTSGS